MLQDFYMLSFFFRRLIHFSLSEKFIINSPLLLQPKHFTMSILKKLPSQERINQAKKLSAEIFGHTWNPKNVRNGAKVLRAPLIGPEVVNYYGKNDSIPTFQDFKKWFPALNLVDPKETYRLHMVADRKKRNKGAPKKKTS